ncbi:MULTISPECIES: sigma-70 family RNA polymerase sigma factor [Enterobacteriaceae]|uniref:sigma-70 family RNA polymerase sigma factor n=1 Tax=Enterobacteriaceae TaxID=543 RepID=UPI000892DB00|nr:MULTISPECIES: sigma-70 family RNA polymerase sigma factor [Phytobacter]AUU91253.1 RNA polymerase subunit sigma-24 [Enterobacteriaceae bacterium ENNIH3]AUV08729.1 RNA polymerase subunit sigma-24 [Enterobacteriaceae bacterium ENNIH2]MDU4154178.1 sigma-70 family RNA polymerase sigma factor [Enterobacteriaceae bacterium]MDU4241606.1 sigma-70 family RNA polymerase sigma factor [Bifidobacterium longum]PTA91047.1 RNA polymerase subunit sigma-24 [Kluyvera sp. Nf5]PWF50312.1 RNA polymerase subunit 
MTTSDVRQHLAEHLTRLWRYGLVLSRNREVAEELVQSTCVRALEKSAQFTPGTRIDSWLFTILHSIWISEVRARRVRLGQGFVESDELLAPETNEQDEARLHYGKIMQYVSALPEAQRNAVFLVYVEGFTYQEAADTLSVPIGTIMSRLATARAKIAQLIHTPHPVQEKRY